VDKSFNSRDAGQVVQLFYFKRNLPCQIKQKADKKGNSRDAGQVVQLFYFKTNLPCQIKT